ncbi:hypothetical protein IWT25_00731 [Secundilactobacillus pentosiphilus]|uniref:Uncharacterized protein n=1 Tax=Secundilactobacillus pentosiphilus TaxID=1714682 RepID=A0A1Z5IUK4_9LACO|nr:hypothetical protein [Secundilactobacillus pentosiphilus]GAX05427.1 hypothetical protein IWT25_00731 [Secundilactobacillus pentosiphilus]
MANNRWRLKKRLLKKQYRYESQKISEMTLDSLKEYLDSDSNKKIDKRHKLSNKRYFRASFNFPMWGDDD